MEQDVKHFPLIYSVFFFSFILVRVGISFIISIFIERKKMRKKND